MATLQIKHFPDELHAELEERAKAEHITMSVYATRVLERDLRLPTVDQWLAGLATAVPVHPDKTGVDMTALMDQVRSDDVRQGMA
ncbi:MAG: hypothetical protein FWF75_05920 [Propionibacteriaceae bacterium]|nr:hypothetical protein [Propionibacteriaceae bacterium]